MKKSEYQIDGMHCNSCAKNLNRALNKTKGIMEANVNFATHKAYLTFDETILSEKKIHEVVKKAGFKIVDLERDNQYKLKKMKRQMWISLFFMCILMYIAMGPMIGLYPIIDMNIHPKTYVLAQFILSLPIIFIGRNFYINGCRNILKFTPNMDSLVAIGTFSAFIYSMIMSIFVLKGNTHYLHALYYESGVTIITLVLLGKYLESKSVNKTFNVVKKLLGLAPKKVIKIDSGNYVEIDVADVNIYDILLLKTGESFAVDGIIIDGTVLIDESMLTGESKLVEKEVGDMVYAGTICRNGSSRYKATSIGKDTLLSKIIKLVSDAQGTKAPIQKLADAISLYFVPLVFIIAFISSLVWIVITGDVEKSLTIFISVLVISCPCALGLATPTAIITASGKGAANALLFKNAESLELLNKIKYMVFDKTGTITKGEPIVEKIYSSKLEITEMLYIMASMENTSTHPLAKAICDKALEQEIIIGSISNLVVFEGLGIKADLDEKTYYIGSQKLMVHENIFISKAISNQLSLYPNAMVSFLADTQEVLGFITFGDVLREEAKEIVKFFNDLNIKTVMLTGDKKEVALAIKHETKLAECFYELLPHEKADKIKELQKNGLLAMIGDGINDAVALVTANIGISIKQGSDIAIESSDIILMNNNLLDLEKAFYLSRYTIRNIKQNLFWAFLYNVLGIIIATGLFYPFTKMLLNPMIAALAMSFSSVSVVLNALRLSKLNLLKG